MTDPGIVGDSAGLYRPQTFFFPFFLRLPGCPHRVVLLNSRKMILNLIVHQCIYVFRNKLLIVSRFWTTNWSHMQYLVVYLSLRAENKSGSCLFFLLSFLQRLADANCAGLPNHPSPLKIRLVASSKPWTRAKKVAGGELFSNSLFLMTAPYII